MLINQIKSGEQGSGIYFCAGKSNALTKNAKPYYSLTLRDSTGILPAKIWDTSIVGFSLSQGDYVGITYEASTYNGQLQLVIHKIDKVIDINPADFFPTSSLGAMMIAEMCNKIPDFPDDLKMKLIHCILAHHGELEMGSPKTSELLESLALSHADNLDAKMEIFLERLDAGGGYNRYLQTTCWTGGDG